MSSASRFKSTFLPRPITILSFANSLTTGFISASTASEIISNFIVIIYLHLNNKDSLYYFDDAFLIWFLNGK